MNVKPRTQRAGGNYKRIFKAVGAFCPFIASCVVVQHHFSSDQHLQKVNRTMHKPGSYQSRDLESHIKLQTGMFYVEANPDSLFVFFITKAHW